MLKPIDIIRMKKYIRGTKIILFKPSQSNLNKISILVLFE